MSGECIKWSNEFKVNIELIDDQHKKLIELINKLDKKIKNTHEDNSESFREVIHEAVEYVKHHFATEEKIMEKLDYPDIYHHKVEHQAFVKEIFKDVKTFEKGDMYAPGKFLLFLKTWYEGHILNVDKKLGQFIHKKLGKEEIKKLTAD